MPPAARRGIGSTAQSLVVELLFAHTTAHRVEAHTDVANTAEHRALEKAGFIREGVTRGAQWRGGSYQRRRPARRPPRIVTTSFRLSDPRARHQVCF